MYIIEAEITSNNLSETKNFYTQVLGLPVVAEKAGSVSFAVGKSVLTFKTTSLPDPVYHFAFTIPANQVDVALSWVSSKLEPIKVKGDMAIAEFESWGARAFYFYDNNGNILEFIARFDLDNGSDEHFGSASVLALSEVAVVTDDVIGLVNRLVSEQGIPVFPKQAPKENFAACGNDEGLIIISQTGRHWYPTLHPAHKYHTKITISNSGKTATLLFDEQTIKR